MTSRLHFALPGLQPKNLETLPPPDAKNLLLRIAQRINGEAELIAKLCDYLPQALRLAASVIAVRANLDPRDYARQLADEKKRLELLAGDDEGVTASITLSYNLLDAEAQKRWRMLAVFPDTFDALAAAAVWGMGADATQETLSRLLQFSMLEWSDSTKRYRLHDLMGAFARQRWIGVESDSAALHHARHYGAILATADELYLRGGSLIVNGLALFDIEWGNIQAGQAWSAAHSVGNAEAAELCSRYPDWGTYTLFLRQHPRERIRWLEGALAAAAQLGNRATEGFHLGNLGIAYRDLGEYRRAAEYQEKALTILRETNNRQGEGALLGNLGTLYSILGDLPRAIEYQEQRLAIAREVGDRRGEGNALGNLGNVYSATGDSSRAIEYYEKALGIAREIGDRQSEGNSLTNLGTLYRELGDNRRAAEHYAEGLVVDREIGDRRGEGIDLWNMSLALDKLGDRKKAIEHAEAALKIREEIEDPGAEKVRKQLDIWRNG